MNDAKHDRARELALAHMAGAVNALRGANRALSEENALLRRQIAELKQRASGSTERGLPAGRWDSDGN